MFTITSLQFSTLIFFNLYYVTLIIRRLTLRISLDEETTRELSSAMEEQEKMPGVLISKISPESISNSLKQQETFR